MAHPSPLLRTLVACVAFTGALLLLPVAPAHASDASVAGTVSEDEWSFLTKLNTERVRAGLAPLVSDGELAPTSRSWSGYMASRGTLVHDPNLKAVAASIEPAWRAVGENIGYGSTVQSLHDAFMSSSGHRANVLKSTYNRVGIGVVHSGGRIWVTVRFLAGPAISGPTGLGPPPPPPGTPAVVSGDFNGDLRGDVLTYGPGTKTDELWFGKADRTLQQAAVSVSGSSYRPVAGDFDGDGRTEIFWYGPGTAGDVIWEWSGSGWSSRQASVSGTYIPLGGDFDGDGYDDIFWYAPGAAADSFWFGGPGGTFTSVATKVTGTYTARTGDLNGDGRTDVLLYAPGTAADTIWYMGGTRGTHTNRSITVNGTYRPVAGDLDGSGTDDIFWYGPGSTPDAVWYMTGSLGGHRSATKSVSGTYLGAAADFDGNAADDLLWFTPSTASGDPVWFNGAGVVTSTSTVRAS